MSESALRWLDDVEGSTCRAERCDKSSELGRRCFVLSDVFLLAGKRMSECLGTSDGDFDGSLISFVRGFFHLSASFSLSSFTVSSSLFNSWTRRMRTSFAYRNLRF